MNTTTNMSIPSELWVLNEKWIIFKSKERKKEKYVAQQRVYVVVNFLFQVIFVFLLFLGMVIYANEVETKEKEKLPEIKN